MKPSYRPDEVAALLAISRRSVFRLIKQGEMPASGHPLRIPAKALQIVQGQDRLMRPREVADILVVSDSTVWRWFWEGKLKGVKLKSGPLRIYESSVLEQLADGDI